MWVAGVVSEMDKSFRFPIRSFDFAQDKPVESSTPGTNPKDTLPVLINGPDLIETQAFRIVGIVLVMDKTIVLTIEPT